MTVNARSRPRHQLPPRPSPASALLRDGPADRVAATGRPVTARDRPPAIRRPTTPGEPPRSSTVVARPVDHVAAPPRRPHVSSPRAGRQGAGPGAPRGRPLAHHRHRRAVRGGRPDDLLQRARQRCRPSTSDITGDDPGADVGGAGRRHDAGPVAPGLPLAAPHLGALLPGCRSCCSSSCSGRPSGPSSPKVGEQVGALADDRWRCRLVPPRRDRQAGPGRLPRPLADPPGHTRRRPVHGHPAVPVHRGLRHRARGPRAGPGHDRRHRAHRLHDVLRGRGQPVAARRCSSPLGIAAVLGLHQRHRSTSSTAGTRSSTPGTRDPNKAYQTVQGLYALGLGGAFGQGLGQSRQPGGLPSARRPERLRVRDGRPGAGPGRRPSLVIGCFLLLAWRGIRVGPARAGHVRGAAGHRHHRLAGLPGVHQHRRGGRSCCR